MSYQDLNLNDLPGWRNPENLARRVDACTDAFGRLRISSPRTLFDSKQIFDNQPLFWADVAASGAGTNSAHSAARASSILSVSENTAGQRVRQTFRRFNYEPGKSQAIFMTFKLGAAASGVTRRVGLFDAADGIFLQQTSTGLSIVRRSSVTGSPVDTAVAQADWNLDKLDGTGNSEVTLDPTKVQILVIDFEWLGVGRVRVGFNVGDVTYYVHQFTHANASTAVYMSTPNLPLRYELTASGTNAAAELETICASVISEGGTDATGLPMYISNGGTHVDCDAADVIYALVGVRLKSAYLGATVTVEEVATITETATNYEWLLILNPTVASTFTYSDVTNSAVQRAVGATANTVTGGTVLAGGYGAASATTRSAINSQIRSALSLGSTVAGTADTVVLCARPLANSADISGGMTIRQLL